MKYPLVIFDFDGTLADSFPFFAGVVNSLADRFGFRRIEESEHSSLRRFSAGEMIRHVGLPIWKLPSISRHYHALMAQSIHEIRLFEGVDRELESLAAAGVSLGVVTSNSDENVRAVLGPAAALVSQYECGVSLFGKPSKIGRILRRSGLASRTVLYVGDEIRDLEAARRARVAFGAVAWGYTDFQALRERSPDEVFERVSEISSKLL